MFSRKEFVKKLKFINLILTISKNKKTSKMHKDYSLKLKNLLKDIFKKISIKKKKKSSIEAAVNKEKKLESSILLQNKFIIPYFYSQSFLESLLTDKNRESYLKKESPFEHFDSYKLRPFILKSDIDIRQESFFIHIISVFKQIFIKEKIPIFLRELDFILIGKGTCLMEYIKDSKSISQLKKKNL